MSTTPNTKTDKRPSALFIVGGLGLGNSTRCAAVITRLIASGWSVDVATAARGFAFFSRHRGLRHLYELKQSSYVGSAESVGFTSVLLSASTFLGAGVFNSARLFRVIRESRPDVIVTDSNYSLAAAAFRGIPLVSLNNSSNVIAHYQRSHHQAIGHLGQLTVEIADSLYQKLVPDLVIVPSVERAKKMGSRDGRNAKKFRIVGPIVREQFHRPEAKAPATNAGSVKRIAVVYSGSGIGPVLHSDPALKKFEIVVIGARGKDTPNMKFVGDTFDTSEWVAASDLVITSGGFSSISETLALRKPMIVVPIPHHAEQNSNAQMIERLGVGISCNVDRIGAAIRRICAGYRKFQRAYDVYKVACDGAAETETLIERAAQARGAERDDVVYSAF